MKQIDVQADTELLYLEGFFTMRSDGRIVHRASRFISSEDEWSGTELFFLSDDRRRYRLQVDECIHGDWTSIMDITGYWWPNQSYGMHYSLQPIRQHDDSGEPKCVYPQIRLLLLFKGDRRYRLSWTQLADAAE